MPPARPDLEQQSAAAAGRSDGPAVLSRSAVIPLLLLTLVIYNVGTGILAALVPVRLAQSGFPASVVGLVSTGFSLGFLAGCLMAPMAIGIVRPRYAIICFASLNAAAAVTLWLWTDPLVWSIARAVAGFGTASLFVLIEAWLAAQSTPKNRGAVFGIYMAIFRLTFMAGQTLLAFVDPRHGALFLVAALAYVLGPLASMLIKSQPPRINQAERPSLLELPRLAPAAAAGSLFHGVVTTTGPALFPIYGLAHGLSAREVVIFLATMQFGGLALQLPLALASDRMERRTMMAGIASATALVSLLFLLPVAADLTGLLILAFLWGGAPAAIYSIAAAHANDLAGDSRRIAWASSLLLIWGIGAATGPLAASLLMDLMGSASLFSFTALAGVATTLFLVWRKLTRRAGAP